MVQHTYTIDVEQLLSRFCERNPSVTPLHVAENFLLNERLTAYFRGRGDVGWDDYKYQASFGQEPFRRSVAEFLTRRFRIAPGLDHTHISLFSGTRCALDMATRGRLDPAATEGPQVLVPMPAWQGFRWIYEDRLGGTIEPVPQPEGSWDLTLKAVQDAYRDGGRKAQALILTNPQNPIGTNYPPQLLQEIFEWVLRHTEMDIVSDEIYAHCQVSPIHPSSFRSALSFPIAKEFPDRVHVAWGFAKDFGVSGFRVGVLASRNKELHAATRTADLSGFSPMTSSNEWFLRRLFTGNSPLPADRLMDELPGLLKTRFDLVRAALARWRIPFFDKANAAQFAWLDLSEWLGKPCPRPPDDEDIDDKGTDDKGTDDERTDDAAPIEGFDELAALQLDPREKQLHECMIRIARVQLLPGTTLGAPAGYFRLCITAVDSATVLSAIGRLGLLLQRMK